MENISDKLINIYNRLKKLKSSGSKMKDIAQKIDLTPSVLSAMYSTVLPAYIKALEDGETSENALDYAFSLVNNVSKRRFMSDLDKICENIDQYRDNITHPKADIPFVDRLLTEVTHQKSVKGKLDGIYLSYSNSSSARAMKVEPYMFKSSDDGRNVVVTRMNNSGSMHQGFAIIKEHHAAYILFNESNSDNGYFAMVSVFLQLPLVEKLSIIKGLYLCLDLSGNPIARRIVLQKVSESTSMDDFLNVPARLVSPDKISEDEKIYYDYTCMQTDSIFMCSVPSFSFDKEDLAREKEVLEIINRKK